MGTKNICYCSHNYVEEYVAILKRKCLNKQRVVLKK